MGGSFVFYLLFSAGLQDLLFTVETGLLFVGPIVLLFLARERLKKPGSQRVQADWSWSPC
jgi:hypothetical protein